MNCQKRIPSASALWRQGYVLLLTLLTVTLKLCLYQRDRGVSKFKAKSSADYNELREYNATAVCFRRRPYLGIQRCFSFLN